MLSPVALATWISFCVPWAEPRLAAALVIAGSGGDAYAIADVTGRLDTPTTHAAAIEKLRSRTSTDPANATQPTKPLYLGLTQIPLISLRTLSISPELALEKCANLEIGYSLFLHAYDAASKIEKDPWRRTALAYNYYRTGEKSFSTPYSKSAIDVLKAGNFANPASFNDPLRNIIAAEWSSGLLTRHAMHNTVTASTQPSASGTPGQLPQQIN